MVTMTVTGVQAGKSNFSGIDAIIAMQKLSTNPDFKSTSPENIAASLGTKSFPVANVGEVRFAGVGTGMAPSGQGQGRG